MSSLVVLRSWSDGKPPVVREIASDSDKNEIIVKPDRKGQFVTEEVPKKEPRAGPPGLPQPPSAAAIKNNYNKFGLASLSQLKFWNKKDKYHTNSGGSSASTNSSGSHSGSPSPPYSRPVLGRTGSIDTATLGPYYFDENNMLVRNHFEKVSLSRESSVPSLTNSHSPIESNGCTSSPPPSPSISRYKNLGPELAATIPKRQIIRKSWIRDGDGDGDDDRHDGGVGGSDLLRKKEMSKSTPALNSIVGFYSSSSFQQQQQQPRQHQHHQQHPHQNKSNNILASALEDEESKELSCVVEDEEIRNNNPSHRSIVVETGGAERFSSTGNEFSRSGLLLRKSTSASPPTTSSPTRIEPEDEKPPEPEPRKKRPLSYADSLFVDNEHREPTFGDVPASVVGVIKKNSVDNNKGGLQSPPASIQSPPPTSPKEGLYFAEKIERVVGSTTYETVTIDEASQRPKIIARQSTKPLIEVSEVGPEEGAPQNEKRKIEVDIEAPDEFTVHSVVHSGSPRTNKSLAEDEDHWASDKEEDVEDETNLSAIGDDDSAGQDSKSTATNNLAMNLQYGNRERLIGGGGLSSFGKLYGNQKTPITITSPPPPPHSSDDADNLSSMIMFSQHARQQQQHQSQREPTNNLNKFTTTTATTGLKNSKSYSHDEDGDEDDDAEERDQHHGPRNNGATAYAQIPIQCVNQHVVVPESFRRERLAQQAQAKTQEQGIPHNLRHHQIQNSMLQQKNTQSRKNFCDELLNDIVLKVPQPPRSPSPMNIDERPSAPSMTPPPVPPSVLPPSYQQPNAHTDKSPPTTTKIPNSVPPQQMSSGPNHDGIIFFDEEDEFDYKSSIQEDSDLDEDTEVDEQGSVTMSEKENSFEYMSVSHNNMKASSPDLTLQANSPTLTKSGSLPTGLPEIQARIGLDIGSVFARFATVEPSFNRPAQIQDICRAIVTSDGQSQGYKSLSHSMGTKSKLIYKWRPANNQSMPSSLLYEDLYGGEFNEEEFSETLETLFKSYRKQFCSDRSGKGITNGHGTIELVHKPPPNSSSSSSSTVSTISISPTPVPNPVSGGSKAITQWSVSVVSGMDKKLVREAAFNSGLAQPQDELRLVNEGTAAAVMAYKHLKSVNKTSHYQRRKKIGKTFFSVNIGSTFLHTSGYDMLKEDHTIHVISPAQSYPYQSSETQFIELLSRLFSPEFILKYESRFTPGWIELLVRFDEMKNAYFKYDAKPFLFVPTSFYMEFYKFTGMQIPECLEENIEEGISWDNNGALRFNKELLHEWLSTPLLTFIKTKIDKPYDNILISGGNGVYDFVVQVFEKELPHVNIYKVPDAENAVVYGLVNMDQLKITFKSPFSIGVGVMTPFDPTKHPLEKCVTRSGKEWCSDVWDNLIRKGQILTVGEIILKRTYVGAQPGQNVLVLPLFKSYADEPKLVTSPSVEKCCELRFEIGKEKSWREVQLIIKCLESGLAVIACGKDGIISQMPIDF